MTAGVPCFLNFIPNRFCFKPEPHELVWKSVTAILHRICVNIFMICFKPFQNLEPGFQIFHIPDPEMCFWAWGRFGMSNNLSICLPICKCSTNSLLSSTKIDRIYLPVNMALALFLKHFQKTWNIFERGIGKIRILFPQICCQTKGSYLALRIAFIHHLSPPYLDLTPYTLDLIPETWYLIPYTLYLIPKTLYLIPWRCFQMSPRCLPVSSSCFSYGFSRFLPFPVAIHHLSAAAVQRCPTAFLSCFGRSVL